MASDLTFAFLSTETYQKLLASIGNKNCRYTAKEVSSITTVVNITKKSKYIRFIELSSKTDDSSRLWIYRPVAALT